MCSSVPGLYVAGGLGGHSNGLIGLATYDGKVVAEGVLGALPRLAPWELPEQQVEIERLRLEALLSRGSDGITPANVKEKVRSVMWEKVGVEKDAGSLRSALADIEDFRLDLLPRMGVKRTARDVNYEWLDAIDAVNMIDACELIIHSSLERKESRGPFMRRDFPNTDNAHWLAANLMKKTENGFRFEQRPYELPFFQPGFVEKNNLEVAW
jgi:succinate dehydrogenase/fumarate reductase flavoprotein subunit